MIQKGTRLRVIDNSGVKMVCCIHIHGYRNRYAKVGDILVVSVRSLKIKRKNSAKLKKGDVCKAIVVRTKKILVDFSVRNFQFLTNDVVLLSRQNKILSNRIFGVIPNNFRFSKFLKLISLSAGFII